MPDRQAAWRQELAARAAALRAALGGDRIPLIAVVAALVMLPFFAFDRIDLRLLAAGEAGLLTAGLLVLPRRRMHLLVFVAMLGAFCVACEGYHRVRWFGLEGLDWRRISPAGYGHPACGIPLERSTYTGLEPGAEGIFKGRRFRVNDRGFRGPAFPERKPPGVYRIVLAGASESAGSGIDEEERFGERLVRRLDASGLPVRIELINISTPGSRMGNLLHAIREEGMRYAPDMLLVQGNELSFEGPRAERLSALKVGRRRSTMPFWDPAVRTLSNRFFFGAVLWQARTNVETSVQAWFAGVRRTLGKPLGWLRGAGRQDSPTAADGETEAVERRLLTACEAWEAIAADARRVLFVIPESPSRSRDRRHLEAVRRVFTPRGATVIEVPLYDLHPGPEADLAIYAGDPHPNAFANELIADSLYDAVRALIVEDLDARRSPGE